MASCGKDKGYSFQQSQFLTLFRSTHLKIAIRSGEVLHAQLLGTILRLAPSPILLTIKRTNPNKGASGIFHRNPNWCDIEQVS